MVMKKASLVVHLRGGSDLVLQVPILLNQNVHLLPKFFNVPPFDLQVLHLVLRVLEALARRQLVLAQGLRDVGLLTDSLLRLLQRRQLGCLCYSLRGLQSWLRSLLLRRTTSLRSSAI